MAIHSPILLLLLAALSLAKSGPPPVFSMTSYAPNLISCPDDARIRQAFRRIGPGEKAYYAARKPIADRALIDWLHSVDESYVARLAEVDGAFECGLPPTARLPTLALASGGGGHRALLTGAGVVRAMDGREGGGSRLAGLYQALMYHAGLSGGAWLVASLAGNDWAPVSEIEGRLWRPALRNSMFMPGGTWRGAVKVGNLGVDVKAKEKAGFPTSLVDPWGRFLSLQLLPEGAADQRLSDVAKKAAFRSATVPYPIMTAVHAFPDECIPGPAAAIVEMHPYEFGSWDPGFGGFVPTAYLGTEFRMGWPDDGERCVTNFDNLGFLLAASSDVFVDLCAGAPRSAAPPLVELARLFAGMLGRKARSPARAGPAGLDEIASFRNPFFWWFSPREIREDHTLRIVDGGASGQNVPVWPFVVHARARLVDVLFVSDSSDDTPGGFPNGTALRQTFVRAQAMLLFRMPVVPEPITFLRRGYNKRAVFFGCSDPNVMTLVYLPNRDWTFPSGQSTFRTQYDPSETAGMIANGEAVASQGGDPDWPTCLACVIMKKTTIKLPDACDACFQKYCHVSGAV
jgi:lysophospholipase